MPKPLSMLGCTTIDTRARPSGITDRAGVRRSAPGCLAKRAIGWRRDERCAAAVRVTASEYPTSLEMADTTEVAGRAAAIPTREELDRVERFTCEPFAADPDALHQLDGLGPVHAVEVVDQAIRVRRDAHLPLPQVWSSDEH